MDEIAVDERLAYAATLPSHCYEEAGFLARERDASSDAPGCSSGERSRPPRRARTSRRGRGRAGPCRARAGWSPPGAVERLPPSGRLGSRGRGGLPGVSMRVSRLELCARRNDRAASLSSTGTSATPRSRKWPRPCGARSSSPTRSSSRTSRSVKPCRRVLARARTHGAVLRPARERCPPLPPSDRAGRGESLVFG